MIVVEATASWNVSFPARRWSTFAGSAWAAP